MRLPPSPAQYLASQARIKLQRGSLEEHDETNLSKLLVKLKGLAVKGSLKLDEEQAIDLAVLFPEDCRETLSIEHVIQVQSLQSAAAVLATVFSKPPSSREEIHLLRIRATCLESLLYSTPSEVTITLVDAASFLVNILACYNKLNRDSKILGGGKWNLEDKDPEPWKVHLLKAKLATLSILNRYFTCLSEVSEHFLDKFVEESYKMLEDAQNFESDAHTPFVDSPLLTDLERMFEFSRLFENVQQSNDDPRLDSMLGMINTVPGVKDRAPGGLQLLQIPKIRVSAVRRSINDVPAGRKDKGKGKAAPEPVSFSDLHV